ncbi:hypothetical protein [Escherichia phage vB_EcoM_EP57]|nr:hypothetical protein [Escherichia phage vB_EcoM_EP57]
MTPHSCIKSNPKYLRGEIISTHPVSWQSWQEYLIESISYGKNHDAYVRSA